MQCLSNVLTRGHVSSTHRDALQAAQTSLVTFAIIHGGHLVDRFNTPTFHHRKFRSCLRGSSHHGRTKLPACVWWSRRTAYLRAKRFLNVVRSYSCSGILYTEEYYTTTRQRQGSVLCRALLNKDWCSGWSYMQCCCVLTSGRRRLCISSVPRGRSDTTKVKEYHSQIVYRALYFASLLCVLVFNVNNWQSGTRGREI